MIASDPCLSQMTKGGVTEAVEDSVGGATELDEEDDEATRAGGGRALPGELTGAAGVEEGGGGGGGGLKVLEML